MQHDRHVFWEALEVRHPESSCHPGAIRRRWSRGTFSSRRCAGLTQRRSRRCPGLHRQLGVVAARFFFSGSQRQVQGGGVKNGGSGIGHGKDQSSHRQPAQTESQCPSLLYGFAQVHARGRGGQLIRVVLAWFRVIIAFLEWTGARFVLPPKSGMLIKDRYFPGLKITKTRFIRMPDMAEKTLAGMPAGNQYLLEAE